MTDLECMFCGHPAAEHITRTGRCESCKGIHETGGYVSPFLRYADSPGAQAFIQLNPDGATLEEVGEALGITRERVRQIEADALRTMRARCLAAGITPRDLADFITVRGPDSARGHRLQPAGPAPEAPLPEHFESLDGQRSMLALVALEKAAAALDLRTVEELTAIGDVVREWNALAEEQDAEIARCIVGAIEVGPALEAAA